MPGCRFLIWREKTREIISGNQNGKVTVWSVKSAEPIYVLEAHSEPITKMEWIEEKQILITCSKDKSVKIWQFPLIWVNEEIDSKAEVQ